MEKIISHIRPIDWTQGDVYGLHFRLSGIKPSVTIHWGDGKSETFWGNEIYARHIYPKDPSLSFIVEAEVERLSMTILLGKEYDLSKCPNLRHLTFSSACNKRCQSLDLSNCHRLESFSCSGYLGADLRNLIVANDAPLKEIDITGHNLHPSCLEAIHRIVDKNNGFIIGEFEDNEENEVE